MSHQSDEKIGTIKIADEVIIVCAANAALQINGVAELNHIFSDNFSKNVFSKGPQYKGVKVSQNDDGIAIDIHVVVDYGTKIPAVAWDIQESVKKEVENMTAIPVKAVNIHVQGVRMKGEGASKDEQNG